MNGGAPESSHAPRRPDCGSRAGACLRQSWLPPRRPRTHPSALSGQALDRLSARVPRLASGAAHAAGSLHGALLPGRGDGARGRAQALRALPPRGLRLPDRSLGLAPRGPAWSRRDRCAAPSGARRARIGRGILHAASFDELPDGTFVLEGGKPWLVLGDELLRWSLRGYGDSLRRPRHKEARVVTPPSLVALLRHNREPLVPLLHPSATG